MCIGSHRGARHSFGVSASSARNQLTSHDKAVKLVPWPDSNHRFHQTVLFDHRAVPGDSESFWRTWPLVPRCRLLQHRWR